MRIIYFLLFLMPMFAFSQPDVSFELAYTGFIRPVDISDPEDGTDRLFIVEQAGRIMIIENGIKLSTPFLDIRSIVQDGGEKGLLGLVFHPSYESNGYFYLNYIDNDRNTVVARYQVSSNPNIADAGSELQIIKFFQPYGNHNAGDLNFGPQDGLLYVALGDGGSGGDPGCRAQDMTTYMGKILRINIDNLTGTLPSAAPSDNSSIEVWASGLRNPWRVSFDRETGDLWIADVGQGLWEEVNIVPSGSGPGLNFGWKVMEGNACYSGGSSGCSGTIPSCNSSTYTDPIYVMAHKSNDNDTDVNKANSITGGYVYRGCKYPELVGKYICSDYVTNNSWLIEADGSGTAFKGAPADVSTYGEDHNGELWLANIPGNIYRVIDENVSSTITLSSADYPLSGTYRARDEIIIAHPLDQDLNGVELITPKITLTENVIIPESSGLVISKGCSE